MVSILNEPHSFQIVRLKEFANVLQGKATIHIIDNILAPVMPVAVTTDDLSWATESIVRANMNPTNVASSIFAPR